MGQWEEPIDKREMMQNSDTKTEKRDPDKSDFCFYPFFQVLMTADGKYKPCSKHGEFITNKGSVLKAGESTLEDAWDSDYMTKLRSNFKNEVRSLGCRECWKEQDIGLKPMRYDSYSYPIPEHQVENPQKPMRLEINSSNVCNLKCRICMPSASHKWIDEARDLYGWNEKVHFNMNKVNVGITKDWIPHLIEIGLFGGEPLKSEENIELLKYCVSSGHSNKIKLLINTNGTVYTPELVELFLNFKQVLLNVSLDDIGERFEYQRKGANWNLVKENMALYLQKGGLGDDDQLCVKICCTVSTLNIYYFPEYFDELNKLFPGLRVYWNLLYDPWQLSIQLLPQTVKEKIKERLLVKMKTSYDMTEFGTKTVDTLVTYLAGDDPRSFDGFFKYVRRHDLYRKESFMNMFPEFWELLKPFEPKNLKESVSIPTDKQIDSGEYLKAKQALALELDSYKQTIETDSIVLDQLEPALFGFFETCINRFGFSAEERAKQQTIKELYRNEKFNKRGFIQAILLHGGDRISHLIHDNTEEDILIIFKEQYLSTYSIV